MIDPTDGERPRYREAVQRAQSHLIAQGMSPDEAKGHAQKLAKRSEEREDK